MNHRVHPLTPVLRAWSFIVASIIFAVTTFSDYTFDLIHRLLSNDRTETLQAAGIIGAGVVIAAGASLLWWRALRILRRIRPHRKTISMSVTV